MSIIQLYKFIAYFLILTIYQNNLNNPKLHSNTPQFSHILKSFKFCMSQKIYVTEWVWQPFYTKFGRNWQNYQKTIDLQPHHPMSKKKPQLFKGKNAKVTIFQGGKSHMSSYLGNGFVQVTRTRQDSKMNSSQIWFIALVGGPQFTHLTKLRGEKKRKKPGSHPSQAMLHFIN